LIKKISDKDKKDWQKFIKSEEEIFNKDQYEENNFKKKVLTKKIDLHGFTLENANKKVAELIRKSFSEKVKKLTIITGKGLRSNTLNDPYVSKNLSILKHSVPEFIKSNSDLMKLIKEIKIADQEDGGSGAFNVYLKNFKE
jgi:DNA-nicking Smr family endonuclease